jgi:hypothetical protein
MFFIALLSIVTFTLASCSALFSVIGLGKMFPSIFWIVVAMGTSLEAAKLMGASYLYRYWDRTNLLLRTYLISGVFVIMVITSSGVFGMLSSGYQTDALPLQQIEEQVVMLQQEKDRKIERKSEIDKQISQLPTNSIRGRVQLMKQFKDEQKEVTSRLNELDAQILELKQSMIETQAHIGPIVYIAKVFNKTTDDATKWLILLIIFAFDPMAISLTLAVNIALRAREDEREHNRRNGNRANDPTDIVIDLPSPELTASYPISSAVGETSNPTQEDQPSEPFYLPDMFDRQRTLELEPMDLPLAPPVEPEPVEYESDEYPPEREEYEPVLNQTIEPAYSAGQPTAMPTAKSIVDWQALVERNNLQELIQYYQELKDRQAANFLSETDLKDMSAIEGVLARHGLLMYVK